MDSGGPHSIAEVMDSLVSVHKELDATRAPFNNLLVDLGYVIDNFESINRDRLKGMLERMFMKAYGKDGAGA